MGMFTCALCDCLQDGDYVEAWEWGNDLVCTNCFGDHTPESYESWLVTYNPKPIPCKGHDWELTHKDYDPPDGRHFTGYSVADVWQQAMEYETEKSPN